MGGGDVVPPMFQPFRLRGLELKNRIVVSAMDMYSSAGGVPSDFHLVHLGGKALGGAALVMTEMVCVSPEGRITPGCAGMYAPEHEAAWRRVTGVRARPVHRQGRPAARPFRPQGLDQADVGGHGRAAARRQLGALRPVARCPTRPGSARFPRELTVAEMEEIKQEFVAATRAAQRCGFDLIELHCAHGYLLSSFISPVTNQRTDGYGGSLAGRLRYPLEVFAAMRAAWPAEQADDRADLGDRLVPGRDHRRGRHGDRAGLPRGGRRRHRRVHGSGHARRSARRSAGPTRPRSPTRSATGWASRRSRSA